MNLKLPRPDRRLLAVALFGALLLTALWYSDRDAKSIHRGFITIPSWAVVTILIAHSGNLIFIKAVFEGKPIDVFNHGRMRREVTYIDASLKE
ncbi:protein of unknown function [Georgfuchsia toluolica]|uniref:Uncharacterized protein n=1 Tax=Georgfuchsia toluolica TaxID=424218 RepID=A0A916N0Q5_9PROT|nr:hypothetical protein [Georgfuchsia toluolica]CAG4884168.1 protein of unknown function [Georgfuchsia toluolica]